MEAKYVFALQICVLMVVFILHSLLAATGAGKYNIEKPTVSDMFHLSVVTATTVGYGDVYPVNLAARVVSWVQMISVVFILAAL